MTSKVRPAFISTAIPVTSSWFTRLPESYARIGISRGAPRGQRGYRMYRKLAPGPWFRSVDAERFRDLYCEQLAELNPRNVLEEIACLAEGRIPALLCFEPPPPDPRWCHRALLSVWLEETCDIGVSEYGFESRGSGWAHPKLSPILRRV